MDTTQDTHVDTIQTSQQKRGEYSDPAGKDPGPGALPNLYGDEESPTGLSTKTALSPDNQLKTSQQIKGEFSLPEGGSK